jgi:hypothetical protein
VKKTRWLLIPLVCITLFIIYWNRQSHLRLFYLDSNEVSLAAITPPPALNSAQDLADLAAVNEWQSRRTQKECRQHEFESKASALAFFGPPAGPLSQAEALHLEVFHKRLFDEANYFTRKLKKKWLRPRPFNRSVKIKTCIHVHADSLSYPSGHAAAAKLTARIYGQMYPARAEAFLKRSEEISLGRVRGGVHYPSDLKAGMEVGEIVFRSLLDNEKFKQEMKGRISPSL